MEGSGTKSFAEVVGRLLYHTWNSSGITESTVDLDRHNCRRFCFFKILIRSNLWYNFLSCFGRAGGLPFSNTYIDLNSEECLYLNWIIPDCSFEYLKDFVSSQLIAWPFSSLLLFLSRFLKKLCNPEVCEFLFLYIIRRTDFISPSLGSC